MESYVLDDLTYECKPLKIFKPDPNYQADEKELEKSIRKNKKIIAKARADREKRDFHEDH